MANNPLRKWLPIIVGGSVFTIAICAVFIYHGQQVHSAELASAEARFGKLDAAHRVTTATELALLRTYKKMDADYVAAAKASNKRHDDDSLSSQAMLDLARSERLNIGEIQSLQQHVEVLDEQLLSSVATVYGDASVARVRQDMAERNEARDNSFDMWWRAAQSIEDNIKAEMDGGSDPNSTDEIVRDYDDSDKGLNHTKELQLVVDRETYAIEHRLNTDWQSAKRDVAALKGATV
ncbi:MAG TPA: hypothetical protein VGX91_05240 [Candidatus Cybelea sp.]|jgi:hypothetical protein|nr:hypothetical protein [Candidatus Cybelea sp.]